MNRKLRKTKMLFKNVFFSSLNMLREYNIFRSYFCEREREMHRVPASLQIKCFISESFWRISTTNSTEQETNLSISSSLYKFLCSIFLLSVLFVVVVCWHRNRICRLSFVSIVRCIFYDFPFFFLCLLSSSLNFFFLLHFWHFVAIANNVCACFSLVEPLVL